MSAQNRRLERQELNATIGIRNSISGSEVGELVNITPEGLMIISDQAIGTNCIFQFTLALPASRGDCTQIEIGVDCLWCRHAENLGRYWSGHQIIDAAPAALEAIDRLIVQYAHGHEPRAANS